MAETFTPRQITLEAGMVADYLKAVGDNSEVYRVSGLVPPLAVTAWAIASLAGEMAPPGGSIHVSQELEFADAVTVGETVICQAKPGRRVDRGQMHLMSIDFEVIKSGNKRVLSGRLTFLLPPEKA